MKRNDDRIRLSQPAASLYVNYFEIAQNPLEFIFELGQYRPGREGRYPTIMIHTWAALSPPYAKLFSEMLNKALLQHEDANGPIDTVGSASAAKQARRQSKTASAAVDKRDQASRRRARSAEPP